MTETFSQSVIEFFGEHGDELPDEVWQIFHRWYHRVEMAKCDAEVSATNEKSRRQRRRNFSLETRNGLSIHFCGFIIQIARNE